MPVLYPSGDVDDIAGVQLLSCFAPLLVVASAGHTDQNLAAALISLVDTELKEVLTRILQLHTQGRKCR